MANAVGSHSLGSEMRVLIQFNGCETVRGEKNRRDSGELSAKSKMVESIHCIFLLGEETIVEFLLQCGFHWSRGRECGN